MQTTQSSGWHVAKWGTLGWAETIVKLIGIIAAFIALSQALSNQFAVFTLGGNPHLAAVILLTLITLIWILPIGVRFQQKEIISMVFSILNLLGHIALLVALLWILQDRTMPLIFGGAYLLGEVIKRRWLIDSGYTESGRSQSQMFMVSNVFLGAYIIFIVFMLF